MKPMPNTRAQPKKMNQWVKRGLIGGVAVAIGAAATLGGKALYERTQSQRVEGIAAMQRAKIVEAASRKEAAQKQLTEGERRGQVINFFKATYGPRAAGISTNAMVGIYDAGHKAFTKTGHGFGTNELERTINTLRLNLQEDAKVRNSWMKNTQNGSLDLQFIGDGRHAIPTILHIQGERGERIRTILVETSHLPRADKLTLLDYVGAPAPEINTAPKRESFKRNWKNPKDYRPDKRPGIQGR